MGLTVAKASLTVVEGAQSYSTTQTVTNRRFRGTVTITGGTVTFDNCWFYGPGFWMVRVTGGTVTFQNCEFGIGLIDVTDEDPNGWQYDDHYAELALQHGGGTYTLTSSYIHHADDLVRIGTDCTITDCYLSDLTIDTGSHSDAIQCTGGTGWTIRDSNIQAVASAELNAGTGVNAGIFVAPDLADISGFRIEGNQINTTALYAIFNNDNATFDNDGGSIRYNVLSGYTNAAITETASTPAERWGNVDENGTAISGESAVAAGDIVQTKTIADTGDGSETFAFDSTPTVGNLVVIVAGSKSASFGGLQSSDITEICGIDGNDGGTGDPDCKIFAKLYETADANAYAVTNAGSNRIGLVGVEIEGPADPINADDADQNKTSGTATTDWGTPTITATVSSSIAIAGIASAQGGTISLDAGASDWTLASQVDTQSFNSTVGLAYKVLSSTGDEDCQFDNTSSQKHATAIANFELTGGGGGGSSDSQSAMVSGSRLAGSQSKVMF